MKTMNGVRPEKAQAKNLPRLDKITWLGLITISFSLVVCLAWLFHLDFILDSLPSGATMKFNTAFCFLLCGFLLVTHSFRHSYKLIFQYILLLPIAVIASICLLSYVNYVLLDIDNLIVEDNYSPYIKGKMSMATASCFLLFVISYLLLTVSKLEKYHRIAQYPLFTVRLVAILAVISYILNTPQDTSIPYIETMSIHTALVFMVICHGLSWFTPQLGLSGMALGNFQGSKTIRLLLPPIFITPIVLSLVLLHLISGNIINIYNGITLYTLVYVSLGTAYLFLIGKWFNKVDQERWNLESVLKHTNQELLLFKEALDATSTVSVFDDEGRITYVNDRYCFMSEYERDFFIGKKYYYLSRIYHNKEFWNEIWNNISTGKIWTGEIKKKSREGSYRWEKISILPFKTVGGTIYQYLTIGQDITANKRYTQLISEQNERLKNKTSEIEQFAYIASHDLQEPLRTLVSCIEIINKDTVHELSDRSKKSMTFINDASLRMQALISGLLDYSRIGKEKVVTKIDADEILKSLLDDLDQKIKETDTQIESDHLPNIMGYETEFRLLLQNLIINGIKFSKPDITPKIKISVKEDEENFLFSVEDNGIGIAPEHHTRIFTIFQRLHSRKEYDGTGIGLSHCKKIIELHKGFIWIESEVNKGSTFYFTIPKPANEYETKTKLYPPRGR